MAVHVVRESQMNGGSLHTIDRQSLGGMEKRTAKATRAERNGTQVLRGDAATNLANHGAIQGNPCLQARVR